MSLFPDDASCWWAADRLVQEGSPAVAQYLMNLNRVVPPWIVKILNRRAERLIAKGEIQVGPPYPTR